MNTSGPWHCKWFLQSKHANLHYMSRVVQAAEGQHTTQLSLGGMICQLCQMKLQLAVTSSLYKQLVEADIFEQLLKVLLAVCMVSHILLKLA